MNNEMTSKTDGRDVDTAIATLEGEGAHQQIGGSDQHVQRIAPQPWPEVPQITSFDTTYYDRPMLKQSVWSIDIPLYYFLGGTAGAALTLAAALQLVSAGISAGSKRPARDTAKMCRWIGVAGSAAGAVLLIEDLGRPSRFLYMMRVFRPTSPMNMGVWILGGATPTAIAAALCLNRRGPLGVIGEVCGYLSGLFGAALAGYTGVLVANTAIPIWQESGKWLPVLFIASSTASAASTLEVVGTDKRSRIVTRIFGTVGRLAEIATAAKVEAAARIIPRVGEPFRHGKTALLWRSAGVMTAASVGFSLLAGKSRKRSIAGGVLGALGSLALRLAIHYLGNASARDPRAAFQQQRAASR